MTCTHMRAWAVQVNSLPAFQLQSFSQSPSNTLVIRATRPSSRFGPEPVIIIATTVTYAAIARISIVERITQHDSTKLTYLCTETITFAIAISYEEPTSDLEVQSYPEDDRDEVSVGGIY